MVTTIQMIDGSPVVLFDDEFLKKMDLQEGDSVTVEPLEGGGLKLTPIRNPPLRQAIDPPSY